MDDEVQALVAEQIAYYRAHAPDYDVAYLGNKDWDECLEELPVAGDVLELACGTGHWTPLLAARARSVTALDAAPEVLALARRRVRGLPVEFIQTDVFTWQPSRRFDTVFFAFWLTHVPPARFAAFWSMVAKALAPGGRACFIDDHDQERANERFVTDQATPAVWRPLRDGSEHRVVKVFYTPSELEARLTELGWTAKVHQASVGPIVGSARRNGGRRS